MIKKTVTTVKILWKGWSAHNPKRPQTPRRQPLSRSDANLLGLIAAAALSAVWGIAKLSREFDTMTPDTTNRLDILFPALATGFGLNLGITTTVVLLLQDAGFNKPPFQNRTNRFLIQTFSLMVTLGLVSTSVLLSPTEHLETLVVMAIGWQAMGGVTMGVVGGGLFLLAAGAKETVQGLHRLHKEGMNTLFCP